MKPFSYNQADLSPEQVAAISQAQAIHDNAIKRLQEDEDRRADHYYECLDDYSYGGICSQVNAQEQNKVHRHLQERIEEIVRGGYLVKERRVNILRDINTNEVVATGTHEGTYGRYFRTEDGRFIGCVKKVSTYEKKGVTPYVRTITEKVVRDGVWRNGDTRYKVIEVMSTTEEVSTEIVY